MQSYINFQNNLLMILKGSSRGEKPQYNDSTSPINGKRSIDRFSNNQLLKFALVDFNKK